MNHLTEEKIIRKVLAGDTPSFGALVNQYRREVFTLAYNIIQNREDAEEVAQDAFVKAFTALTSFKHESRFSTWLYRIVMNTALNKKKLHKWVVVPVDSDEIIEEADFVYPLIESHENRDRKKFIQLAMSALRDEERICITLFYQNELSVNEISEFTGMTITNCKVLLHRGRKHLYEELRRLLKTELNNLT